VDLIDFAASRVGQIQVANNALVLAQDADRVRMDNTLNRLQAALTRLAKIEARIATSREQVAGK
jgi:ABC-type enterochelin transport system ATPase subunit